MVVNVRDNMELAMIVSAVMFPFATPLVISASFWVRQDNRLDIRNRLRTK